MTASDAEIRTWAKAQGLTVQTRGPVPPHIRDAWDAYHGSDPAAEPEPHDDDFAEPGDPPPDLGETRPRNVATPRSAPFTSWRSRHKGSSRPKTAKRRPPRVPVDDLIAGVWRGLAGFARPLPATSRLLKIQAPVAGVILEGEVKGSAVDRFLQPFARTSKGAEALFVLAGPPIMMAAMEMHPDRAPFIMPVLRESMLRWCKIAGPKMADALKRDKEFEELFGEDVDALLATLAAEFTSPADEEDAVREAQERMGAAT
jgi:hypothetical protein